MERREFKVDDCYRICPKCGEWVPAKSMRCDKCAELLSGTQLNWITAEDLEQETQVQVNGEAEQVEASLRMYCHGCHNSYTWGKHTLCPNCGGTLVPKAPDADEENYVVSGQTTVTEQNQKDIFCYTLYRHTDEGEKVAKQQKIPFIEEETFGRIKFLSDPRFFFEKSNNSIRQYYAVISRENVIIRQDAGRLTAEMIPGKNAVRLNGKKLQDGVIYELHDGDLLRFGEGNNLLHMIDLKIEKVRQNADLGDMQDIRDMFRGFQEQVTSRLEGLEKAFASIKPEDLVRRDNESDEEFGLRLTGLMQDLSNDDREKLIRKFLQIKRQDGKTFDCSNQAKAVLGSNQMTEYLFQAVILERLCESKPDEMDYNMPMGRVGLLFEEFVMFYILPMIYKAEKEVFEEYVAQNPKITNKSSVQQGAIIYYLLNTGDDHIVSLLKAAGCEEYDGSKFRELKQAIRNVKDATVSRNQSLHAKGSKDTTEESLNRYREKNESSKLNREEYMRQKEKIFCSESIRILYGYYLRICKDEAR